MSSNVEKRAPFSKAFCHYDCINIYICNNVMVEKGPLVLCFGRL